MYCKSLGYHIYQCPKSQFCIFDMIFLLYVFFFMQVLINLLFLYSNRILHSVWLLAAWHELIFLVGDAKKSYPLSATMYISYALLGNQAYLLSPSGLMLYEILSSGFSSYLFGFVHLYYYKWSYCKFLPYVNPFPSLYFATLVGLNCRTPNIAGVMNSPFK